MSKYTQLSFPQGDDKTYTLTIKSKDSEGVTTPIDITNATIQSFVRAGYNKDVLAVFDCVVTDGPNGVMTMTMDNVTSAALPVKGSMTKFFYDVEITYTDATKAKVIWGDLVITREVTY